MNVNTEYSIPEGTPIVWRNVERDLKLKPHRTEATLRFDEVKCSGDGGLKYFFELGDWLIVVDSDRVRVHSGELAQTKAAG